MYARDFFRTSEPGRVLPDFGPQPRSQGGGNRIPGGDRLVLGEGPVGPEERQRQGKALAARPRLLTPVDVEDPDLGQGGAALRNSLPAARQTDTPRASRLRPFQIQRLSWGLTEIVMGVDRFARMSSRRYDSPIGNGRTRMMDQLDPQMSGTAEGLIAFLDWAARTGELSPNTAAAYKTAVTQVLEIDGDAWSSTNIQELSVDRQFDRFARLRASRYNATSLRTYGNRFRAAIKNYLKFLEDPTNFRTNQPPVSRAKNPEKGGTTPAKPRDRATRANSAPSAPSKGEPTDLIQYPFPLRSGVMVYLSLPRDLRRDESQRIAAFVASLAIDPSPDPTDVRGEHP